MATPTSAVLENRCYGASRGNRILYVAGRWAVARLEVFGPLTADVITLDGERLTVGSGEVADFVLAADRAVSRTHARLEQINGAWFISDLDSRNGTFVNTARLSTQRMLKNGDEILIGRTRLVFRDPDRHPGPSTETIDPPPELTRRERDVLVELCRPVLSGSAFTAPATVAQIAARLFITDAAVKQHLARLYDKFRIADDEGQTRRTPLANAALSRGAVTLADLRKSGS